MKCMKLSVSLSVTDVKSLGNMKYVLILVSASQKLLKHVNQLHGRMNECVL